VHILFCTWGSNITALRGLKYLKYSVLKVLMKSKRVVSTVTNLRSVRYKVWIQAEIFLFSKMSRLALGSIHPAIQGARGNFLGYSGRDKKLTTHLTSSFSVAVLVFLRLLQAFVALRGTVWPLHFSHFNIFIHKTVDFLDTVVYFSKTTCFFASFCWLEQIKVAVTL